MHRNTFPVGAALLLLSNLLSAQQFAPTYSEVTVKGNSAKSDTLAQVDDNPPQDLPAQAAHVAWGFAANPGVPWPATDALGRSLPMSQQVGPPKPGRFVGIFYFLTHTEDPRHGHPEEPLNIANILKQDPNALNEPTSPLWGDIGESHYWGEPLYGYYNSTDPWVLRRHAQLLADAGVDVLIFDTTNANSYPEAYFALLKTFQQIRQEGGHTPQIAFMVNTEAGKTAEEIYHALYQRGLYRDLWFIWDGKPLMICDPKQASDQLRSFFTLRAAHWPFTLVNTPYAWHWEATYPQPYGYTDDPTKPEELNVSVAQNLRWDDGKVTNMSEGFARGRSFHDGKQHIAPGSVNQGYNFQEQWKRVFKLEPPFVMITGWNEWTAGRFSVPGKPVVFVDQYNEEFSRDIEPQKGGHGDDYYYQMVANIRRYKGVPPVPEASAAATITFDGKFGQWQSVAPEYMPSVRESLPRDCIGVSGLHYTNETVRNDFASFKVARDAHNIYFYAQTRSPITPSSGRNWMWLLIDTDRNPSTGWEGYDFIVNRTIDPDGHTWLEKNVGGWNWVKVAPITLQVVGNEMQLAIPRTALGLKSNPNDTKLDFKWTDNLQHPGEIMDFYLDGEVAPEGRFNFRYETR
jgi:hypothetical protein